MVHGNRPVPRLGSFRRIVYTLVLEEPSSATINEHRLLPAHLLVRLGRISVKPLLLNGHGPHVESCFSDVLLSGRD